MIEGRREPPFSLLVIRCWLFVLNGARRFRGAFLFAASPAR